jgi:arylsulfatase A-like enzyme
MSAFAHRYAPLVSIAALAALGSVGCERQPMPSGVDVLLVTVDTLRADFVHSYGFPHETTPNIDALAERGALFEMAVAASTATVPSHASIMTSRYVREHSVGSFNGATRLEGATTLAERFRAAGYETAAFVSNVVLKSRTGLDTGFDRYDDDLPEAEVNRGMYLERDAGDTSDRAIDWLRGLPRDRAFFLWVHLQDPHGPYNPPPPFDTRVDEVPLRTSRELPVLAANRGRGGLPHYQALEGLRRAPRYAGLYAGEVAFVDEWIGRLVRAVREREREPGTVILLTADHGESLDEAGFFFQHGHATTPEQARVPFLVVAPGVARTRVAGVVSHVDIAPTLLEFAGLPALEDASGISLVRYLRRGAPLPARSVLSDIGHEVGAYDAGGYWTIRVRRPELGPEPTPADRARALRDQQLDWLRFERVEGPAAEAGTWRKGGKSPLPAQVLAYLSEELEVTPAKAMSEADVERLRALGYLGPAPPSPESPR